MWTNDLKKGAVVLLKNGFTATLLDSKRGTIRIAKVEGDFTEIGSIYTHNIVARKVDGIWVNDIEYTEAQLDLRGKVRATLFS